jgi:DNA polymerase-1
VNSTRLDAMRTDAVAFDTETHMIQPGLVAPPLVCGSFAIPNLDTVVADTMLGRLADKESAREVWLEILRDEKRTICGANIAYDVLVMATDAAKRGLDLMPLVFKAYDFYGEVVEGRCEGRIFDVQLAETLHAIAGGHVGKDPLTGRDMINPETGRRGRYSLRAVVDQVLGRDDAKVNDRFRTSYATLEDVPIEEWPMEARTYPVDDAVNTLEAALAQAGHLPSRNAHRWFGVDLAVGTSTSREMTCSGCGKTLTGDVPQDCMVQRRRRNLHDLSRQCYAALAMHLGSAWGFRVDQAAVDELEKKYEREHGGSVEPFERAGVMRKDGTENQSRLKWLVATAYGSKEPCHACRGTGKIPSVKTNGRTKVNCDMCDGTALSLTGDVPRTEKGAVGKGRDVLQESGDELLMDYADHGEGKKIPNTYVPYLRGVDKAGVAHPDVPLNPRPNPLLETGRTSYDGVIQLMPRGGGVRECIVAREGRVFSSVDYAAGEMVTHAQSCIWMVGYSKLAEALNLGLDAHLALAGTMCGKTYEEALKLKSEKNKQISNLRQAAKPANFGFPGGMSELKLVLQQRKGGPDTAHSSGPTMVDDGRGGKVPGYKGLRFCLLMDGADACGVEKITTYKDRPCPPTCKRCVECAKRLKDFWFRQWPENNHRDGYFAKIKRAIEVVGESGTPEVVQHVTRRARGGVDYCSAANGYFQALLADAAKNALCQVARECYDSTWVVRDGQWRGGPSPLLGSRAIFFGHDEIFSEHPDAVAHEASHRVSEVMVRALTVACPDLKPAIRADPCLMKRWYKGAEARFVNERLVPWEPK